MPGIKALRKIQLGKETPAGTIAPATAIWRGMGTLQNLAELVKVEEDVGLLVPTDRAYIPFLGGEIEMDEVEATFEQLPYIGLGGIDGSVTGQADGAGTDKIWTFEPATTTVKTPKTFSIEGGDNQQAEVMEYSHVTEFKLSGKAKEALMMGATWTGRQIAKQAFTTALSIPTVEDILFSKGKLYIDAGGGTIGTTLKSSTFLEMSLSWKTGFIPVFTADGALYFTFVKGVLPEIELELTFEHDATSVAEKDAWLAGTGRLIQCKFEGSSVVSGGTTYQKRTLILNLAGKWKSFDKLDEADGNDIVKGTLVAGYNSTWAKIAQMIVVNELAAMP